MIVDLRGGHLLSTGLVTSPYLQNLEFQILAMAKMQTAGNNEERFVLASLKEFVKTWGTGGEGSFQLDCKGGQCKMSMELNLGAPGSSHFTPAEDNQNTSNRDKRRKNPSTLRRDKKRAEQNRAQRAGLRSDAAGQVQHAVEEHERADQHGGVPHHPPDPAAGTMTVKSKKKRGKKRENGGKGSEVNNLHELDIYRTSPLAWASARAIPKALSENATKALTNFYNSGAEMAEGAALLPFDPPILWDEDTSLWDFVLEQGHSGREPQQEMIALKEEISTNTGSKSPMMREFWAALSFGMTVLSCQDGIHLGWRRRPGLDGGLGGSSWNVEQVKELRARLWASKTFFTECLGREVTNLQAEKMRMEVICMATGLSVRYETLGPDSWDLILA